MVRYSVEPEVPEKTSKARGSHLRVHFKHCREIAHFTKGMKVEKALKILDDVIAYKAVIPFVKYTGGIGRKAMAKQCRLPVPRVVGRSRRRRSTVTCCEMPLPMPKREIWKRKTSLLITLK